MPSLFTDFQTYHAHYKPSSLADARYWVGAIVFNGGHVLMIQRGQPPAHGLWSIPGGKQEPGEGLAEACCREVAEETGLAVTVQQLVAVAERRLEGFHYVILDFLAVLADPAVAEPQAYSDALQARWVALSDLADYPMVEGLAVIITRSYKLYRNGGAAGLIAALPPYSDFILPAQP